MRAPRRSTVTRRRVRGCHFGGLERDAETGGDGGLDICPGVRSGEVAVGPFIGELARLDEHDRHVGRADLQFGESVGNEGSADPVEFEHLRESVLDDHGSARQRSEVVKGEAQICR